METINSRQAYLKAIKIIYESKDIREEIKNGASFERVMKMLGEKDYPELKNTIIEHTKEEVYEVAKKIEAFIKHLQSNKPVGTIEELLKESRRIIENNEAIKVLIKNGADIKAVTRLIGDVLHEEKKHHLLRVVSMGEKQESLIFLAHVNKIMQTIKKEA